MPLLPRNCSFTFATGPDFVLHGALGHSYNHWLFSRLLEEVFPPAWSWEYLPAVEKSYGCREKLSGKERLRETLRNMHVFPLPLEPSNAASAFRRIRFSAALTSRFFVLITPWHSNCFSLCAAAAAAQEKRMAGQLFLRNCERLQAVLDACPELRSLGAFWRELRQEHGERLDDLLAITCRLGTHLREWHDKFKNGTSFA